MKRRRSRLIDKELEKRLDNVTRMGGFITQKEVTDLLLLVSQLVGEELQEIRDEVKMLRKRVKRLEKEGIRAIRGDLERADRDGRV